MSDVGNKNVTGGCLCGSLTFVVRAFDRHVVACHCKQCRKQTGHYVAATRAQNIDIQMIEQSSLTWFKASEVAERGFCSTCGSLLFWRELDSNHTSIMAGCLDTPTGLTLDKHIFVDDKGDYYDLEPGIPTYSQSD